MHRLLTTATMTAAMLLPVAAPPVEAASLSVKYSYFRTPVKRGNIAKVTAHSGADVKCTIKLVVNGVILHPGGAKYTNGSGNVSWSWTVARSTRTGKWPVTVTCQSGTHKGSVSRDLRITA
jgi:hypothetical protein